MFFLLLFIFLSSNLFAEVSKEELLGKINPQTHPDFAFIESEGKKFWLRKEVVLRLKEMIEEAKKDGINLTIVSAFRSYTSQKKIWEKKAKRYLQRMSKRRAIRKLLNYSSMPGTSRHHWGTDVDLVSVNLSFYETKEGKIIFQWLSNNASRFGFFTPYFPERKGGYKEEKWHWSYRAIATNFLSVYTNLVKYEDLTGFYGFELAEEIDIFNNFVLNVND